MNTHLRVFSNIVAAGTAANPGIYPIDTPDCDFFRFMSVTEGLIVSVNDGPDIPVTAIPSYKIKEGDDTIQRLVIKNTNSFAVQVRLIAGRGDLPPTFYGDMREPSTEGVGWSGTSIGATSGQTFTPQLTGQRTRRKAVIVSNLDPAANLQLRDASNNIIAYVGPAEKMIFPISETVIVFNPGGSAISCAIGEVYWRL